MYNTIYIYDFIKHRFAILAWNTRKTFELIVYNVRSVTSPLFRIDCSKVNPHFVGSFGCPERVECQWSSDSSCIAIGIHPHGDLIIFSVQLQKFVRNIFPDVVSVGCLSRETTFDFYPFSILETIIALGSNDRFLYTINANTGHILNQTEASISEYPIDCLKWSPVGDRICVALRNYDVHLYDAATCSLVHKFNINDHYTENGLQLNTDFTGPNPSVTMMNFSFSGEQLATCTNNGEVQIWRLPKVMNLQNMCRLSIQKCVPYSLMKNLPLPSKLIDNLLNMSATTQCSL